MPQPTADQLRGQIVEHFGSHLPADSENLLSECIKLCQLFNITPSELFYKWEALTLDFKTGHSSILRIVDTDSLIALKGALQRKVPKQENKAFGQPAMLAGVMSRGAPRGFMGFGAQRSTLEQPSPSNSRGGRAPVKPEVDNKMPLVTTGSGGVQLSHKPMPPYRYMYEKLSERSDVLDDRIDDFAEIIRRHYEIAELSDPAAPTEEDVVVVGRIVSDSEVVAPKLNDGSIVLESSRMMGSGARVPLKFDSNFKIRRGHSTAGFFPGAIVALKGRNGGGGWFSISEVLSIPPTRPPPAQLAKPEGDASFTMCIASGPYTLDSDMRFKPWKAFMTAVTKDRPDAILLMGPFIDSTHSQIKTGDINDTPRNLFRIHIEQQLNDLLESAPNTAIIIIPSVQDMLSDFAVFPQFPMNVKLISDYRVHFLSNPCRFSINGVTFAASTVDVLFHLRKEEFVKRGEPVEPLLDDGSDAMANLCRHLLQQRSMYPIFPVPVDSTHEVNLDISHSELLDIDGETDESSPHVLILPSRLKHFAKEFDGTNAVNPSYLTKGTFAQLSFSHPGAGDMKESIKVEIRKL